MEVLQACRHRASLLRGRILRVLLLLRRRLMLCIFHDGAGEQMRTVVRRLRECLVSDEVTSGAAGYSGEIDCVDVAGAGRGGFVGHQARAERRVVHLLVLVDLTMAN